MNENSKKEHMKINVPYVNIVIFVILFLSGSFVASNDILSPLITKLIWTVLCLFLFFKVKKVNVKIVTVFVFLIFGFFVSTVINRDDYTLLVINCLALFVILLTISYIRFESFILSYIDVISCLCSISLIMTILFFIFPNMKMLFNVTNINGTATFSNFIIYVRNTKEIGIGRNCGMFWEPGAFQTFISIALLFELSKSGPNIKRAAIFIATIITTFSTTGYIAIILIIIYAYINKYNNNKKIKNALTILFAFILIFVLLNKDLLFSTDGYTTFGKLILYQTSEAYSSRVSSVSIRINAVIKPIFIFMKRPLFGVGNISFRQQLFDLTLGVNTCTFINWFAIYGILCGFIMIGGVIGIIKILSKSNACRILMFVILFVITISENYVNNSAILLVFLYGYQTSLYKNIDVRS